jgi:crossover junction endodeoxyribonuclease RuvC
MKIGIDPGITGAIAVLKDDLTSWSPNFPYPGLYDMPVMAMGKHQQVNTAELAKILSGIAHKVDAVETTVYLEQVNAMPGQGVVSMFNFGMSYGAVLGVCGALMFPVVMVRPNAWKKTANLIGKPKEAARTLAQQLYPELDLSLKKHVGRADALLIARFGFLC